MPFYRRSISPVFLSNGHLKELKDDEREAVINSTLSRVLRQLASLLLHAEDIFHDLQEEFSMVSDRASVLQARVNTVQEKAKKLDAKAVIVPESDLTTFSERSHHHSTDYGESKQLFAPETRPAFISRMYDNAVVNPVVVLRQLDFFRSDGVRSSKFFTCTPTYRTQLDRLPLDIETRKPEALEHLPGWTGDDEDLTSPVHPDLRFHRLGHTLSEGALYQLPDPDRVTETRTERFGIEVVPVDVTGKGFQRLIKFRQSLVNFDYVKRRRKRRDRNRRNTIGDTSDIQRAVRGDQPSTSGAGRAGDSTTEASDQQTQTETSRLDSSTGDEDQEASFSTHTVRADIELAVMAAAADASASIGRLPKLGAANTFDPPAREPVYELIRRARLPLGGAAAALRQRGVTSEASSSGHGSASNRTSADSERVVSPADSGTVTSPLEENVVSSPRRRHTSPVDSGLSDGDRRLEEASLASDDTITPDLPDDGDNSSAFSCDTEGYYTSFHCDSGLRSGSGHESEYDLVGRGSTGTGTASNTSGSDSTVVLRKKPPPPPRCSSLEAGNRESIVTVIHVDEPTGADTSAPDTEAAAADASEQTATQNQQNNEPAAPSEERSEDSAIGEDRSRSEEREHSLSPSRSETRSESDLDLPERQTDFRRITAMTSGRIPSLCVITPPPSSDGDETDWMPPSPVRFMQIVSGRGPAGATVHVQPPPPPPPLAPPPDNGEWSIVDDADLADWVNADDQENNNSGQKDAQELTQLNRYNIIQKSTRDREYLLWADIPAPDQYRVKDAIEDVYGNVEDVRIRRTSSNVVSPHVFRLTLSSQDDNRRGLGMRGELEYVTLDDIPKPNVNLVPFALLSNQGSATDSETRRAGARVTLNPAGEVIYSSGTLPRTLSHSTFEPGDNVASRGDTSAYTRVVTTPRPARHQPPAAATSASVLMAVHSAAERPPLPLPDDAPRDVTDSLSHHDVSMGSLSGSDTVSQGSLTDASSVDTLSGAQDATVSPLANLREWGPVSGGACEAPATPPGSVPELSISSPSLGDSPPEKTSTLRNGCALMAALEKSRRLLDRTLSDGGGLNRIAGDETVPGLDASGSEVMLVPADTVPAPGKVVSPSENGQPDEEGDSVDGEDGMSEVCLGGGEAMTDVTLGAGEELSSVVSGSLSGTALSTDSENSPLRSSRPSESSDGEPSTNVRPVPGIVKIDYSKGMVRFPEKKPMYLRPFSPERGSGSAGCRSVSGGSSRGVSPAPSVTSRRSARSGSGTPESPASLCTVVSAPARGVSPAAILSGFRSLRRGQTAAGSSSSSPIHYLATMRRHPSSSTSSPAGSVVGVVAGGTTALGKSQRKSRPTSPASSMTSASTDTAKSQSSLHRGSRPTSPARGGCSTSGNGVVSPGSQVVSSHTMVRSRSVTPPAGSRRRRAESPAAVFCLLDPNVGRSAVPLILPATSGAPSERTRRGAYVNLQHVRRSLDSGGVAAPTATVAPQRRSLDVPTPRAERETPTETHIVPGKPIETDFFDPPSDPDKPPASSLLSPEDDSKDEPVRPGDVSKESIQSTDSSRSVVTVRRNNSYKLSVGALTAVSVDIDDKTPTKPAASASRSSEPAAPGPVEVGSTVAIRPGGTRNVEPVRVTRYRRPKGSKLFIDPSIFKQSAKDPRVDVPKSLQISKNKGDGDTEIW